LWRQLFERRLEFAAARQIALCQLAQGVEPRAGVRFGKHHVETDRRDAILIEQPLDQRGHDFAAPRPAPHAFEAGFVDVENRHAVVEAGRCGALQPGIMEPGLGALHGRNLNGPADMRRDQQDPERRQEGLRQSGRQTLHRMR
jgi:hypothetical protein